MSQGAKVPTDVSSAAVCTHTKSKWTVSAL